jgi:hypothetical protein
VLSRVATCEVQLRRGKKPHPTQRKIHTRDHFNLNTATIALVTTAHTLRRAVVAPYRYAPAHVDFIPAPSFTCPPASPLAQKTSTHTSNSFHLPAQPLPSAAPLLAAPRQNPSSWHNYGRRPTVLHRLSQPAAHFSSVLTDFPCVAKTYYDSCLSLESEFPVFASCSMVAGDGAQTPTSSVKTLPGTCLTCVQAQITPSALHRLPPTFTPPISRSPRLLDPILSQGIGIWSLEDHD